MLPKRSLLSLPLALLGLATTGCQPSPNGERPRDQAQPAEEVVAINTAIPTLAPLSTSTAAPTSAPTVSPTAVSAQVADPSVLPSRPNVILLMTDDHGWGETGYNGHPHIQTPNLDQMAASGAVLNRFYVTAPICSPTRVSILTGRHHNRSGCFDVMNCTLDLDETTLPEQLQTAGYSTAHFGKWHVGRFGGRDVSGPADNGFDYWVSSQRPFEIGEEGFSRNGESVPAVTIDTSEFVVSEALTFIEEQAASNQPFFTVIWYSAPHTPWVATEEDKAVFAGYTEEEQNYYGELYGMDRSIGMLRQSLRDLGIADNTLIWFNGDNGPARGAPDGATGGLSGSKSTLQEGGIRVPAVIEWPAGIPVPFESDVPISTLDMYPTILELAGIDSLGGNPLDGISLTPLLANAMPDRTDPIPFWYDRNTETITADTLGTGVWIQGEYKLVKTADGTATTYQLYNLTTDPAESQDIANSEPDRVAQMSAELNAWQQEVFQDFSN